MTAAPPLHQHQCSWLPRRRGDGRIGLLCPARDAAALARTMLRFLDLGLAHSMDMRVAGRACIEVTLSLSLSPVVGDLFGYCAPANSALAEHWIGRHAIPQFRAA